VAARRINGDVRMGMRTRVGRRSANLRAQAVEGAQFTRNGDRHAALERSRLPRGQQA
jgi:hypothetical protein